MSYLAEELIETADAINASRKQNSDAKLVDEIEKLKNATAYVARAWCGSNIGYHANIYWEELAAKPANVQFSSEWGLQDAWPVHTPSNGWIIWDPDEVIKAILVQAGWSELEGLKNKITRLKNEFNGFKETALSKLLISYEESSDSYIERKLDQLKKLQVFNIQKVLESALPTGKLISRDMRAMSQGLQSAPHQFIQAHIVSYDIALNALDNLEKICREAGSHLRRTEERNIKSNLEGSNIFLGHGQNPQWREVKDFIQDRLQLPVEEFNSQPVAGVSTQVRLSDLLNTSAFAFLVMTGEDETSDGKRNARLNVVHEVGLFQGRIGFKKAIILLEEGCEEFSNIHGLGQIRFPKGHISAVFEDIRAVLEREGLIDSK